MITKKEKERRKKLNFYKLINDEIFRKKFVKVHSKPRTFETYKRSYVIPTSTTLNSFIKSYKYITNDNRDDKEIFLWLLSE